MTLQYIWSKFWKNLPLAAIHNTSRERPSSIGAQSMVLNSSVGRYTYCGYGCTFINCRIGRFCSIASDVTAGLAGHPVEWASTSSAFYRGGGRALPHDMAMLEYHAYQLTTTIGNDVWIGQGVFLRPGITVGNGAVIGMGSVVTHDIPPYAVAAGNPARIIKMRFSQELIERMESIKWWDIPPEELKQYAQYINNPKKFLQMIEKEYENRSLG